MLPWFGIRRMTDHMRRPLPLGLRRQQGTRQFWLAARLAKAARSPLGHFRAIPEGTHFSIIHPLVDEIGASIAADGQDPAEFAYLRPAQ
jgi:hypothetical protein